MILPESSTLSPHPQEINNATGPKERVPKLALYVLFGLSPQKYLNTLGTLAKDITFEE